MRIIPLLFFSSLLSGQTWTWDTLSNINFSTRLAGDNIGHVYEYAYDSSFFQKISPGSLVSWQKTLSGGAIRKIVCAPDSSVYVAGNFSGSVIVDNSTITALGGRDMFIARFDGSGNLLWLKRYGSKADDYLGDMCVSGNKPVCTGMVGDTFDVAGQMVPHLSTRDLFVLRLQNTGAADAVKIAKPLSDSLFNFSDRESKGYEIAADRQGNICVFFYLAGKVQIDTNVIRSCCGYYGSGRYLMKFDQQLNCKWFCVGATSISGYWGCLRMTSQGDILYIDHEAWHMESSVIRKISADGLQASGVYAGHPVGWGEVNRKNDMVLDSCDNIYFAGTRFGYYPQQNWRSQNYLFVGQVSSSGQLHWYREDSADTYLSVVSLALLSPNNCFVKFQSTDTVLLSHSFLPVQNYTTGYATLQTTVGIPANVSAPSALNLCSGGSTTLEVASPGAITWYSTGTAGNVIGNGPLYFTSALSEGTYTYYAEASTCTSTTGRLPVTLTVYPNPEIVLSDGIVCHEGSYTISPFGCISYKYSGGSAIVSPTTTTSYTVSGTNVWGCTGETICTVSVIALPQPSIVSSINFMCPGQTATLTGVGAYSYTWQTGQTSPTIAVSPTINTMYTVTASDQYGCTNSAIFPQFVYDCSLGTNAVNANAKFEFYPNPTEASIFFDLPSETRLRIINALGQEVYSAEMAAGPGTLDFSAFPPGAYCVECGSSFSRVVKQ